MRFTKNAKTIEEQADLLIQRGLICKSLPDLKKKLSVVSYYRLSSYLFPYKISETDDNFKKGTTFDLVWDTYIFDRQLRLLIMDVIERFEISLRTKIVNEHSLIYGPFGYINNASFPKMKAENHKTLMNKMQEYSEKCTEYSKTHYYRKYDEEQFLPFWIVCELVDFGTLSVMYEGLAPSITNAIAQEYKIHKEILRKWIRAILYSRNLCAHHQRVWNRIWAIQPFIPNISQDSNWHSPVLVQDDKLFGVLTVLRYLQKIIAPQSSWKKRFFDLLGKHSDIPKDKMGFPDNWQDSPIWKD